MAYPCPTNWSWLQSSTTSGINPVRQFHHNSVSNAHAVTALITARSYYGEQRLALCGAFWAIHPGRQLFMLQQGHSLMLLWGTGAPLHLLEGAASGGPVCLARHRSLGHINDLILLAELRRHRRRGPILPRRRRKSAAPRSAAPAPARHSQEAPGRRPRGRRLQLLRARLRARGRRRPLARVVTGAAALLGVVACRRGR